MKAISIYISGIICLFLLMISCSEESQKNSANASKQVAAKDILGNSAYKAISYGGYRQNSRDIQPSIEQLKDDMRILNALGIKLLRTYNVSFPHAANVLEAIKLLKAEDPKFEMYVMLGAWIDCKDAWTDHPNHELESEENAAEIKRAVELTNQYQDIVKVIAVGNEAMVHWATSYYVKPKNIFKWVNHLQNLKDKGQLHKDLWITSSDNYASWGGGDTTYHLPYLDSLLHAVDFISMHTYPMHDTHYNPDFWNEALQGRSLEDTTVIKQAMKAALNYAKSQYRAVKIFVESKGIDKEIHIGETGWASYSNGYYGFEGSKACDEYKQALYYDLMDDWTTTDSISCFYFEAFDEPWKDAGNSGGSENHFGLFTVDGKAKYVLWDEVDKGTFKDLSRDGNAIEKSFVGDYSKMMSASLVEAKKELVE